MRTPPQSPTGSLLVLSLVATAWVACAGPSATELVARRLAGQPQARSLTCESRSAADLASFHDLAVSEAQVFARIPRSDNPDLGFVGDPDEPPGQLPPGGYGVHAEPVAVALRALGLDATAARERTYPWLMEETRAGRPVIVWITASCDPSRRTPMIDAQGRRFTVVRGEHTVLVVAADGAGVVVIDPAGGLSRRFERADFEASWSLLDRMAVSARGRRQGAPEGPK